MEQDACERLLVLLETFESLNPELVEQVESEALAVAGTLPASAFDTVLPRARSIVGRYLESPVKRAERDVLAEYLYFLEQGSKRLLAAGEPDGSGGAETGPGTLALVPRELYDTGHWLRLVDTAEVPIDVGRAVDAAQRRNELVPSVVLPLFRVLRQIDGARLLDWQLSLAEDRRKPVDPDLARDILHCWAEFQSLPQRALRQALMWSDDQKVVRHWPAVTHAADRLLRRASLTSWLETASARLPAIRHLQLLAPFLDDERITRWYHRAITRLGDSIEFFATQAEALTAGGKAADVPWRHHALFRELIAVQHLLSPLLLLADLYLSTADGAVNFALAIFGFTTEYRRSWEAALQEQCAELVRRCFLTDLKRGRPPTETIHRLCFGDAELEETARGELDLLSGDFDSVGQRERVVDLLGPTYKSYREPQLLNAEIGRRYRRMMRVLHEDNLRRVLTPAQFDDASRLQDVMLNLSVMAAEGRRFLSRRRNLELSTVEVMTADLEFVQRMRELRGALIHQLLGC